MNGITCPSCATKVSTPLMLVVPVRSITAVGSTFVTVTCVVLQLFVVSSSAGRR